MVTVAITVLRPLPLPASRARLAMPRSSVSSVVQVTDLGTARSATPLFSDSANVAETRQLRTIVAGVESLTAEVALAAGVTLAAEVRVEMGGARSGRTTRLANRA